VTKVGLIQLSAPLSSASSERSHPACLQAEEGSDSVPGITESSAVDELAVAMAPRTKATVITGGDRRAL
jgi:hypothetical protein